MPAPFSTARLAAPAVLTERYDPVPRYASRRSPVMAENMVATSHPLASQAGLSMMEKGGNAIDAALAAAIALTILEPTGNGVGSDAFAIVWDGERLEGLNASGRAPQGWTPERFPNGVPERGWDSVTVPGAVGAWVALSDRYGALPFGALFEPAIRYARDGFCVTPMIGRLWARAADQLRGQPGFADHFLPGGRAPAPSERFVARGAAETLERIAETRGKAFYRGDIAERMAQEAARHGGALTVEDLAANQPEWCGTIAQDFDEVTLHEIPPNGQGIAAQMALGMLSHTSIREMGPDEPRALHLMTEAMKLAFRDAMAFVGEPAAMTEVTPADLLDPGYLAERAALIDPNRAQDFQSGAPQRGGTVYLAAADASGRMVSYIQSNYVGFGSGVVVPGAGVHFQNRGYGFTTTPGHPNQVGPGKRPFHTIIPAFLMERGAPRMAFGVMGGPMQPQGHLQMTLRTALWGQDVQSAIDAPRWRVTQGLGLLVEDAIGAETAEALAAMGHDVGMEAPDVAFGFGGAQLIEKNPAGGYVGGSDPRKDGAAVGF